MNRFVRINNANGITVMELGDPFSLELPELTKPHIAPIISDRNTLGFFNMIIEPATDREHRVEHITNFDGLTAIVGKPTNIASAPNKHANNIIYIAYSTLCLYSALRGPVLASGNTLEYECNWDATLLFQFAIEFDQSSSALISSSELFDLFFLCSIHCVKESLERDIFKQQLIKHF